MTNPRYRAYAAIILRNLVRHEAYDINYTRFTTYCRHHAQRDDEYIEKELVRQIVKYLTQ